MLIMKKDMGGAATVLALAHMIMAAKLKVRLRVLIPAVENSISGNAFRPLDVFTVAQGHHGRDRQHRRRGPAGPRRRAGAGRRGEARPAGRSGHADRRRARRARARICRRSTPTTRRSPPTSRAARTAENDPLWRMPLWPPYDACSTRKSPTSTTRRRAALPARSPARCSCSASSSTPKAGCMSTSMPGRRPRSRPPRRRRMPGRARDLRAAERALWLIDSIRASRRRARSRGETSRGQGRRRRALSTAKSTR